MCSERNNFSAVLREVVPFPSEVERKDLGIVKRDMQSQRSVLRTLEPAVRPNAIEKSGGKLIDGGMFHVGCLGYLATCRLLFITGCKL